MRWFFAALLAITLSSLLSLSQPAAAADPQLDELTRGPVGKDWVTNGGNLTNQRFSTLKQINPDNTVCCGWAIAGWRG